MAFRFSHLLLCLLLAALPVLGTSCGTLRNLMRKTSKQKGNTEPESKIIAIGTIEIVNPEERFVLIRTTSRMQLKTGTKLECVSPTGIKSTIEITPESKLSFLSADIVNGFPQRGDAVIAERSQLPAQVVQAATNTTTIPGQPGAVSIPAPGSSEVLFGPGTGNVLPAITEEPVPGSLPQMPMPGAATPSLPLPTH